MKVFNLWLTGLSGAGKTTLAFKISKHLKTAHVSHEVLDGDVYRPVLSPGAGYSEKERNAFRHKIIFLAKLLNKHGISCIIPVLSSSRKVREFARNELINFNEVYVKCPIDVCTRRDPDGLYKRAKSGKESNIVGVHIPYEEPENPEILIDTSEHDVITCVEIVMNRMRELGLYGNDNE